MGGSKATRTVIIGLDGVPYQLMDNLSDRDVMPNFKDLKKEGVFKPMKSSLPEVSAVSWASIITGKNPGEHGVYGFTDMFNKSYTISFHSSSKIKAPTFWQIDETKKYVVINLPATYPAQKINGVLITGFVSLDLEKAVYPREYVEVLKETGYQVDIDVERAKNSNLILFKQLHETLKARMKVCMKLWDKIKWDLMMVVFTGTDRLEHFLWSAYEDEKHEQHPHFLEYFRVVDSAIGEINSRIGEEDNLLILSDHGMEGIKINVNLNALLAEKGYLKTEDNPKRGYNSIQRGTKAFALDPSRIYLNKEGRYPRGSIAESEEEEIIQELTELFYSLEWHGKKVVKRVYRKEEIYRGPHISRAPDLVLLPENGFNLKAGLFRKEVFEEEKELSGKHNPEAFIYVKGSKVDEVVPEAPSLEDVLPIIWKLEG